MSGWAEIDAWKLRNRPSPRVKAIGRSTDSVWHVRTTNRLYRYVTKDGKVREWYQHNLGRCQNVNRLSLVVLCSEIHGPLPARVGDVANRHTAKITDVTCESCRVLLDREMEAARLDVDALGHIAFVGKPPEPAPPFDGALADKNSTLVTSRDCPPCPGCGSLAGSPVARDVVTLNRHLYCAACGIDWEASPTHWRQAVRAQRAYERAMAKGWI